MLHIKTPYRKSINISNQTGFNVYLKLDNGQPSGSFKIRGIGNLCSKATAKGCSKLICSSGGNAGLAAAYAAQRLKIPIEIFTPQSTPDFVIQILKEYGAKVTVIGEAWDESDAVARQEATKPGAVYVPPFNHPDIWEGHTTIIDEIVEEVSNNDDIPKPDLVICSCGGGGLFCGIVEGLRKNNWNDIPVLVMETEGASSFYQSFKSDRLVTLPAITSIAKSLGAKTIADQALTLAKQHKVIPAIVSDKEAVQAVIQFLNDERILVEPACSVSLAVLYTGLLKKMVNAGEIPSSVKNVAVIVCGGNGIKLDVVEMWKKQFSIP